MKDKNIKIRTVFMGSSEFGSEILDSLVKYNYNVVGVFTKPDAKAGRKKEIASNPVKTLSTRYKLLLFQPQKFTDEAISSLKNLKPDLIIVANYGKILPEKVLSIPGFGAINVHTSLLPKYRGPSPIQNALLNGEKETGVSIMLMDKGLDTGDILSQESLQINSDDTCELLYQKLSNLSVSALITTLPRWINREIEPKPQNDSEATICQLIEREDGKIIWENTAEHIYNQYRALHPWPGIFAFWRNEGSLLRLKLKKIKLMKFNPETKYKSGEVFEIGSDIGIQTMNGVIILEQLQLEGKKQSNTKEFINGYPNFIGSILI